MTTEIFKCIVWDKKRITKPGLYSGLPMTAYHRGDICEGPSVSSSSLRKLFNKSPAHYWDTSPLNKFAGEDEDTRPMIVGRAMHHLAFGEANFIKLFASEPEQYQNDDGEVKKWSNNARQCRAWQASRRAEGRTVLTQREVEAIKGMAAGLRREPLVAKLGIFNGYVERSGFVKDDETGLWLKVRPDCIPSDSGEYVDLKTIHSVEKHAIRTAIHENGYHMQAALIRHVVTKLGLPFQSASLVFVEKTRPHCVRIAEFDDEDLDRGDGQNREAIREMARCLKTGVWPGPGAGNVERAGLPDWARKQIDRRLQMAAEQERGSWTTADITGGDQ